MIAWATKKKALYFTVFVLFVVFVLALPSFVVLYKSPTCSDGKQNGGEQGIDCGGQCQRLCASDNLDPLIVWTRSFQVGGSVYAAVAQVENPNLTSSIVSANYIFRLYDAANTLIVEQKGTTFIPPKKIFYVFEGGLLTGNRKVARTTFEFDSPLTWQTNKTKEPDLVISNQTLTGVDTKPHLEASVKNPGLFAVSNIEVVAVIYNAEGNSMAASRTLIDSLNPGAETQIIFTWREPFEAPPVKIDLVARVYPAGISPN